MIWLFRSIFVMAIYTGMIIYTGLRLFVFIKHFQPLLSKRFFWPFYLFFSYSFFFFAIFRLDRVRFIRLVIMYLPVFFLYLFAFIFLFDMISLVLYLWKRKKNKKEQFKVGIALILTLVIMVYSSFHARDIKTAHYSLGFNNLSAENLRIVLVSDLHIGPTVGKTWVGRIVDCINAASPDMVCIAGDIFDSGTEGMADPESIASELRRINAPLGIFACPGNHDADRRTRSIDKIDRFLSEAGITFLADETVPIQRTAGLPPIFVTGRRDVRPIGMQSGRLSAQELKNRNAGEISPFMILLDHQPIELPDAAEAGFDLILCGHTHKGQVFPGMIFTYFIFKKAGGTHYGHWQKGNTRAIITSGAGVWGPPLRFASNSEIAVIDIKKQ